MQGTLLFLGLLLLLWVPLIAFSSGNPTYQVPNIVSFEMNASLSIADSRASTSRLETLSFPVFEVGHQRSRREWVTNTADLPSSLKDTYTAPQAKLLCTSQVAFVGSHKTLPSVYLPASVAEGLIAALPCLPCVSDDSSVSWDLIEI